jgi:predicted metal-dependent hydrolase
MIPPVRVRRSARARRLRISLCPWRGVELVLPVGCSEARGRRFLEESRSKIERSWSRLRRRHPELFDVHAPSRLELPLSGECLDIAYRPDAPRLEEKPGELCLPHPASDIDATRASLKHWLAARAKTVLPPRVARLAAETGLRPARVQIRDQRSRWGSCSARGTVSLNLRLLFHRPEVVRYLILHELCHLREMNHGPRFKALLASHEPQWQRFDRELSASLGGVPAWLGW